ncbi:hypothetical protein AAHZ94_16970 [Streptomyces sp. HSW2009]|uniref:hypothetical protein n=1 Tax=Streptomyces sp. HSW2009 TaxID=3142890 RepID=UPI0032EEBEC7
MSSGERMAAQRGADPLAGHIVIHVRRHVVNRERGEGSLGRAAMQEEPAITAIRKSLVAVGCTVALAAGSTACGSEENLSAGQRLSRATDQLGERDSISVQMSIDAAPKHLQVLADDKDDPMPLEAAEFLSKAQVTFSTKSKKPLESSSEADVTASQLKISGPGGDVAEYRLVGNTAYYRMNLAQFAKLSGEPAPSVDELKGQLPEGFEAAEAILAGKWIKIDMADIEALKRDMGEFADEESGSDKPSSDPTLSAETSKKLVASLKNAFAGQVVTEKAGSKDGADLVRATASVQPLVTALVNAVRPIAKELPGGAKELPTAKDIKELPNNKVTVDFALKKGELSGATVDLVQLDEKLKAKLAAKGGDKLPLQLAFEEPTDIGAPAGATKVDVNDLMMGLGSLFSDGFGRDALDGGPDASDSLFGDEADASDVGLSLGSNG